eukprot:1113330-Prymnesium_polylepis.1
MPMERPLHLACASVRKWLGPAHICAGCVERPVGCRQLAGTLPLHPLLNCVVARAPNNDQSRINLPQRCRHFDAVRVVEAEILVDDDDVELLPLLNDPIHGLLPQRGLRAHPLEPDLERSRQQVARHARVVHDEDAQSDW